MAHRAPAGNRVALADAGLLRALCTETLSTTAVGVITSYRRALRSRRHP